MMAPSNGREESSFAFRVERDLDRFVGAVQILAGGDAADELLS